MNGERLLDRMTGHALLAVICCSCVAPPGGGQGVVVSSDGLALTAVLKLIRRNTI